MYGLLKSIHVICAAITISGFVLRGFWMLLESPLLAHKLTRIAPHIVDTLFLLSGIFMLVVAGMNPFGQPWLIAKFVALIAYILLGMVAIRRGPTKNIRAVAFVSAIAVFGYVIGVGMARSPASWLALI